jgi:hypothetical protein
VFKDLLPCLDRQNQALLLRCLTVTTVPAYFIRRERKLVEAAQKSHSEAASPLDQGLGRRSPGSFFLLPLFTNCVVIEFSEVAPGIVTPHTYLRCTAGRG